MNDTLSVIVYILSGAFGLGYFVYGKRQSAFVPMLCGAGLMVYPYFVSNAILLVVVGVILLGVPYFIRY